MTALTENPAVTDPCKHLTHAQRTALIAVDHYRHQKRDGREIVIGRHRFKLSTLAALKEKALLRGTPGTYAPTLGGALAVAKLKGEQP